MTILAVDGGQTAVRVRAVTPGVTATAEIHLTGITRLDDPMTALPNAVADAVAHLRHPRISRVVLGLTTAPTDPATLRALGGRVGDATGAEVVWIADDTVIVHAAALHGAPGVALWVGTGVACLAVGDRGLRSFDGLGFLLGDRGGAFSIGRTALARLLRRRNLAGSDESALTARAESRFGPLVDMPIRLHDSPTRVLDIASFAKDVVELADIDHDARQIVDDAAADLADTAHAAANWVGPNSAVVVGGGVMATDSPVFKIFCGRFANDPHRRIRAGSHDAIDGAEWLAVQGDLGVYESAVYVWNRGQQP